MNETRDELLEKVKSYDPWFYDFDLGQGDFIHSKLPGNVRGIHETRLQMTMQAVNDHFGERLQDISCLDIGCHEGFYSFEMAKKVKNVNGIDVREDSLKKAELVRRLQGAENISFQLGDCYKLEEFAKDPYDLTLFLGVLYHLDNPIQAMRSLSLATKELCILETQVIDENPGETEWGSRDWSRSYNGTFALIDERAEFDSEEPEAGSFGLVLCPSLSAVCFMLEVVGFKDIQIISPPEHGYEQLTRGKRVIVAASK